MGDGDDFPVVVNGGLSPFDIELRQSCRLQSKSVSFAAEDVEERAVLCRSAYRLQSKTGPSSAEERTVCRRPPPSCTSLPDENRRNGRATFYPFLSTLHLSVVCSITTSLIFSRLLLSFTGECTILPTYAKSYFLRD